MAKSKKKDKNPRGDKILAKKTRKLEEVAKEVQKRKELQDLIERGKSEWAEARSSDIHETGLFAKKFIPKGTRLIEYVGPKLKTKKAEELGSQLASDVEGTGKASVFMFVLNKKYQIDGNQEYNDARFANHSCDPNSETDIIKKRIYIIALRDIQAGEEVTYDYSFDVGFYKDNPCRCGSENCVGHIVSSDQWDTLKKKLKKAKAKADKKAGKSDKTKKKTKDKKKTKRKKKAKGKSKEKEKLKETPSESSAPSWTVDAGGLPLIEGMDDELPEKPASEGAESGEEQGPQGYIVS